MRNFFLLLAILSCSLRLLSQDIEGPEFKNEKRSFFFDYIDEFNGHIYYCDAKRAKGGIKFTFVKYNSATLELVEEKEIAVDSPDPGALNYRCDVLRYHDNGKFYLFYSLIHGGDYHINLVTLDDNLTNVRTTHIGDIIETGYEGLGSFSVDYSFNHKSALISLKNKCEKKKAIGTNTNVIYENTELVYINLISGAIEYKKNLPIELEGSRVKTTDYNVDDQGNATFLISLADRKGQNTIKAIGFGFLKKGNKDITIKEINTENSSHISSRIHNLASGDLAYTAILDNSVLIKILPLNKPGKILEFSIPKKSFKGLDYEYSSISSVEESENGYFIDCFTGENSVTFISKNGELKWSKELPLITSVTYNYHGGSFTSSMLCKNRFYIFMTESKAYEMTDRNKKLLENKTRESVYNNKNTNLVMLAVNEKGEIEKTVIYDNAVYGAVNGNYGAAVTDAVYRLNDSSVIIPIHGKNVFRMKKVLLN